MFYLPEYDAFQKERAVLSCSSQCDASYFMKQSGLKKEYDSKNWRVLAVETYFEESRKLAESEDFACAKRTFFQLQRNRCPPATRGRIGHQRYRCIELKR